MICTMEYYLAITKNTVLICEGPQWVAQDVPLCYADCFELKPILVAGSRETSASPNNPRFLPCDAGNRNEKTE